MIPKTQMQDTGLLRTNSKEQYYTKSAVAKKCIDTILAAYPTSRSYQWIEPSAGNGAFLKILSCNFDKVGIDIEPKSPEIIQADFLTWSPTTNKKLIFFGNPPFGRQGSLAKSFIKHAADHADIIAFILPRSFVKPSMNRAFPLKFHCTHSEELEKNAFEVNEKEYDVPCVFQIWEKKVNDRVLEEVVRESGFSYVKHGQPFDIAMKRVGGLAGQCNPFGEYNRQYHYFLKLDEKYRPRIQDIMDTVNLHTFPSNTVGPRSLSKSEVNEVMNVVLAEI